MFDFKKTVEDLLLEVTIPPVNTPQQQQNNKSVLRILQDAAKKNGLLYDENTIKNKAFFYSFTIYINQRRKKNIKQHYALGGIK